MERIRGRIRFSSGYCGYCCHHGCYDDDVDGETDTHVNTRMRCASASVQMGSRALADGITVHDMGEKTTANVRLLSMLLCDE